MKKIMATVSVVAAAVIMAPTASAVPIGEGCVEDFWMWGLRPASRMICDGERQVDGSWLRVRGFFDGAYTTNPYSRCYSYGCTYYPSRYVPELNVIDPAYVVTDGTIPGGEPGWIPSAEPRIVTGTP